MVRVLYTKFSQVDQARFDALLRTLPQALKDQILKYRRWEDKYASLIGKQLLSKGLSRMGIDMHNLGELKYTTFDRPYLAMPVDFNISHSGDYVVCALSNHMSIGVDIEKVESLVIDDFKGQCSEQEWKQISSHNDPLLWFYRFWTRKEAITKADGRGLNLPMHEIDVINDPVNFDNRSWNLYPLNFESGYCSHLALSSAVLPDDIQVEHVAWPESFIKEEKVETEIPSLCAW